ncbi:MAG TPA: hypothetical protein VI756_02780 [Blastocatellia bacterium]
MSSSKLFEFHDAFWSNLHHFLYVEARAQMNTPDSQRGAVAGAKNELQQETGLPGDKRRAWDAALEYYQHHLATRDLVFDDSLIDVTTAIDSQESSPSLNGAKLDPALMRVLTDAAPVYRQYWWPRHDQANRKWLSDMQPLLDKYESTLSSELARAFNTTWPADRLPVYLCGYGNWAGAYTTTGPSRITIGTTDPGNTGGDGLETLFHESLHTMDDKLDSALDSEAKQQHKTIPRLLPHALIFYTAGWVTQHAIPDHTPYAESNGIWKRGDWGTFKKILDAAWQPYLNGNVTFDQAIRSIIGTL